MGKNLKRLHKAAATVADSAAKTTGRLVEKGKSKVDQYALQGRLAKLQRQLGALVYAQHKSGQAEEETRQWYYAEIDRAKAQLAKFEKREETNLHVTVLPHNKGESDFFLVAAAGRNYPKPRTSVWVKPSKRVKKG